MELSGGRSVTSVASLLSSQQVSDSQQPQLHWVKTSHPSMKVIHSVGPHYFLQGTHHAKKISYEEIYLLMVRLEIIYPTLYFLSVEY